MMNNTGSAVGVILCIIAFFCFPGLCGETSPSRTDSPDSLHAHRPTETILPRMVVTAKKRQAPKTEISTSSFDAEDLKLTAGAIGDIGRYLGTLPSTVSALGPDFDNTFYVRGGDPTETLFLVDGIEFENINHFSTPTGSGGPISFVNDGFVHAVDFYAGNMPIGMPPRLSSIVDITLKPGSFTRHTISGGVKLTGGLLSLSGPILPGKASFALAGRYADFGPLQSVLRGDGIPRLGDILGKVHYAFSESGDFSIAGLLSINDYSWDYAIQNRDNYRNTFTNTLHEYDHINQGGVGLSLKAGRDPWKVDWTAGYSARAFTERDSLAGISDTFYTARYAANPIATNADIRRRFYSNVRLEFCPRADIRLVGGLRLNRTYFEFETADHAQYSGTYFRCSNGEPVPVQWEKTPTHRAAHLGTNHTDLYASSVFNVGILRLDFGLTGRYFAALRSFTPSPRLGATLDFGAAGKISTHWAVHHQFPTTLIPYLFDNLVHYEVDDDSVGRSIDRLLEQAVPRRNRHMGLEYRVYPHEIIRCGLAVYHKWYDQEFQYSSPDRRVLLVRDADNRVELAEQSGLREAYGFELSLDSDRKKPLFGGTSLSLLEIKNRYTDDTWYPDWTNVGYTWSLTVGARILESHTISVSGTGSGARPYCRVETREDCVGRVYPAMDEQRSYFSDRLEPIVTLNARYGYELSIRGLELEMFLEVINIPDYQPILEYKFSGTGFEEVHPYGITPILGVNARFGPH